jgi:hypothetical protein
MAIVNQMILKHEKETTTKKQQQKEHNGSEIAHLNIESKSKTDITKSYLVLKKYVCKNITGCYS